MKASEGFVTFIHAGNNKQGNIFAAAGGSFDIEEDEEVLWNEASSKKKKTC